MLSILGVVIQLVKGSLLYWTQTFISTVQKSHHLTLCWATSQFSVISCHTVLLSVPRFCVGTNLNGCLFKSIDIMCDPVTGPVWPRGWVEVKLYCSMTAALEGGEWSAARPGHTLPPVETLYPLYRRLGGPQGQSGWTENLVPTGIQSWTVQPVVSRCIDWATRINIMNGYKMLWHILRGLKVLGCWLFSFYEETVWCMGV